MPATQLIRAGDTRSWLLCKRRAWYDHNPPSIEMLDDAFDVLIRQAGYEHEEQVKNHLEQTYGALVEARDAEHTEELMAAKTPVIYQAVMTHEQDQLTGKPDFLILKSEGYQVADAKLASSIKSRTDIKIQLAIYRRLFKTSMNGLVYLGSGEIAEVGPEVDAKCQQFISGMQQLLALNERPEASFGFSKCSACPYYQLCLPEFEQKKELTLLYDIREQSARALNAQGVLTINDLARANVNALDDAPYFKGEDKKQKAIWRAQSYLSGNIKKVLPIDLPEGTWLHFDIESNPLANEGIRVEVYCWGLLVPDYKTDDFVYFWSNGGKEQDYAAWCEFLSYLDEYRQRSVKCVIAHYSHFEVAQIKTYAARYGMESHATVAWLLGNNSPLFDLQKVVKNTLILPLKGYGLKAICKDPRLVNFQWELEESGSQWSVVRYQDFLLADDPGERACIKREILSYNRDDVKATRAMELWLRKLSDN